MEVHALSAWIEFSVIFYQYFVVYTSFHIESLFRFNAWLGGISVDLQWE